MCEKCSESIGRTDSVEVSQNAKGDFSFKVKIYFDNNKDKGDVVKRTQVIYNKLHSTYG